MPSHLIRLKRPLTPLRYVESSEDFPPSEGHIPALKCFGRLPSTLANLLATENWTRDRLERFCDEDLEEFYDQCRMDAGSALQRHKEPWRSMAKRGQSERRDLRNQLSVVNMQWERDLEDIATSMAAEQAFRSLKDIAATIHDFEERLSQVGREAVEEVSEDHIQVFAVSAEDCQESDRGPAVSRMDEFVAAVRTQKERILERHNIRWTSKPMSTSRKLGSDDVTPSESGRINTYHDPSRKEGLKKRESDGLDHLTTLEMLRMACEGSLRRRQTLEAALCSRIEALHVGEKDFAAPDVPTSRDASARTHVGAQSTTDPGLESLVNLQKREVASTSTELESIINDKSTTLASGVTPTLFEFMERRSLKNLQDSSSEPPISECPSMVGDDTDPATSVKAEEDHDLGTDEPPLPLGDGSCHVLAFENFFGLSGQEDVPGSVAPSILELDDDLISVSDQGDCLPVSVQEDDVPKSVNVTVVSERADAYPGSMPSIETAHELRERLSHSQSQMSQSMH